MKAVFIPLAERGPLTPKPVAPGEWRFVDRQTFEPCAPPAPGQEAMLQFRCLLRDEICGYIRVGNGFKPSGDRPSWQWNGSTESPTLTPSINCLAHGPRGEKYAGCGWHNFLTNGEWGGA